MSIAKISRANLLPRSIVADNAVTLRIIGNLSNHDGNAKENVTLKVASKYFKLFRDSFNSFNLSNVAE